MARDKLEAIRAMRLHAVEQARHALAECLRSENELSEQRRALDQTLTRNRAAAASDEDMIRFLDFFVLRVQATRADRDIVDRKLVAAGAASAEARGNVMAARVALESVETLIGERRVVAENDAQKKAQHALDDIVRSLNRPER